MEMCMIYSTLQRHPQPLNLHSDSQYTVLAGQHLETVLITYSGTSIHDLLQCNKNCRHGKIQLILRILGHIQIFQDLCLREMQRQSLL